MVNYYGEFEEGFTKLCDEHDDVTGLTVHYFREKKSCSVAICDVKCESAILLLSGDVEFECEGEIYCCKRSDVFADDACCIHFCKDVRVKISSSTDYELLLIQKENDAEFDTVFYDKASIDKQTFGEGALAPQIRRTVTTIIDYDRAPYSKMVVGEVYNGAGMWTSYPPHHHPQPEAYFYRFDKPQGFGGCFIGDECYTIRHNSLAQIPWDLTHPQCAAPGYALYYVWMIPHLEDNIWRKTRVFDERHEWLTKL